MHYLNKTYATLAEIGKMSTSEKEDEVIKRLAFPPYLRTIVLIDLSVSTNEEIDAKLVQVLREI